MALKSAFIFLFITCTKLSFCQFSDSAYHHLTLTSSGVYNKTKDLKSFVLSNAVSFDIHKKRIALNTDASWIYGTQNKVLSNNDFSAAANVDYLKDIQRFYYWALVSYDKSYSLKINYRFQAGAGGGYTFVKQRDLDFEVSDGFLFETSGLTDPATGKDDYQTVRNSIRIKYHWSYNKTFVLEGANFFQPSMASFSDNVIRLSNKLSVKLNKWLSVDGAMSYNRISRTHRENFLMTYGFTIDNYF